MIPIARNVRVDLQPETYHFEIVTVHETGLNLKQHIWIDLTHQVPYSLAVDLNN